MFESSPSQFSQTATVLPNKPAVSMSTMRWFGSAMKSGIGKSIDGRPSLPLSQRRLTLAA